MFDISDISDIFDRNDISDRNDSQSLSYDRNDRLKNLT